MSWISWPASVWTVLTLGLLACSAGCSPVVRSIRIGESFPPRPVSSDVQLYSVRLPDCPFEEIGLLDMEKEPGFLATPSSEERVDAMKTKARQMGGDAIIGLAQLPPAEGFRGGLSGTVIRFPAGACVKEVVSDEG